MNNNVMPATRTMRPRGLQCLLLLFAAAALAQDAPPPTAAQARDLKPRPAEIAPLAAKSLLLAITRAGSGYVAVGDRGAILRSTDVTQWQQMPSPVHATLTAVTFADAQNGWAAGHDTAILHTRDGGQSWALQNFQPELNKPVLSLLAFDAQHALAAGAYGLLLETTDGGKTWTQLDAPALLEDGLHLNALIRLGDGTLFVAGETGLIGASPDGKAWQRLKLPYEGSLFGALPRGEKGALVFGLRGNIYASDDVRGGSWRRIDAKTTQSMFGGAVLASGEAVLVGADGEIVVIGANDSVRRARGPQDEATLGSGTLSAVVARNGELLLAGELGVSNLKLAP